MRLLRERPCALAAGCGRIARPLNSNPSARRSKRGCGRERRASRHQRTERQRLREFATAFDIVPADSAICEMGGDFRTTYAPSHGVDLIDGIIAATSVVRQIPLVTLNKKHFPMLTNVVIPYRRRT